MNDLLFYALILALLYYFFIYLPQQRQVVPTKPFTQSQSTQTTDPNPIIADNSELEPILDNLIKNVQQLNKQIK